MKTTGTNPDIEIIFEDNHLLAVNKPKGLLSQEDRTGKPDLLSLCKDYIKKEYNKPGNVFLGLLHRLDRPVSGIMLFAKTSKAAGRISEQIRKRNVQKTYLTVVEGAPPASGMLSDHLLKDKKINRVLVVQSGTKGAKKAELTFQRLDQKNGIALLSVNLITGRAHQIRVQLAQAGFPIWGDQKYGTGNHPTIALHAWKMTIQHPTLKNELTFSTKIPEKYPWGQFDKTIFQ
jgi:23S rRNA pseudouridine1911/1915/1917 synthase